jgi:hypothetical protein
MKESGEDFAALPTAGPRIGRIKELEGTMTKEDMKWL